MKAIVCINQNWGIGKDGQLLHRFKEDMKHFRELTYGKTIIYGRKTLDTFPGGKPLEGRMNIVLSSSDHNISDVAKDNCWYYASIKRKDYKNKTIVITGVRYNDLCKAGIPEDRTILLRADSINMVERIGDFMGTPDDDIFICGGASVYRQMLQFCNKVYVTQMIQQFISPDVYFPNLEWMPEEWDKEDETTYKTAEDGTLYKFITYTRKNNK